MEAARTKGGSGPREDPAGLEELERRARELELGARRTLGALRPGDHRSLFRGAGLEFEEVRPYRCGDPVRTVDWKVTARTGELHVKRYEEERELPVVLVVDVSASMAFGTGVRSAMGTAAEAAAVLGLAGLRSRDRVGMLLFSDRPESVVPPGREPGRLRRLLLELLAWRPTSRATDLAAALRATDRLLARPGLVFLLSDLRDPPGLERGLAAAGRHEVVAVEPRDPGHRGLPPGGLVELADPETGGGGVVHPGRPETRARLRAAAAERDERVSALLRAAGADHLRLRTDRDPGSGLAAFLRRRAAAGGRGRDPAEPTSGPAETARNGATPEP